MGDYPDDRVIRSYLLGEMPAEERAAFQERIFENDEVFLRVLAAEDDLTDALARGALSADEAARVRAFLEESSQRDRLPIARAMAQTRGKPSRVSPSPVRRILALAACLILAIAAFWLALRNHDAQTQIAQVTPAPPVAGGVFAVHIPAGTLRGSDQSPTLQVPPDASTVELRLQVRSPGDYPRYRIEVNRTSGQAISSVTVNGPLSAELPVRVSRAALTAGEYEITLSGLRDDAPTPIEYYYFSLR
jgi:hypothetical protein